MFVLSESKTGDTISEFLVLDSGSSINSQVTEHYLRKVLAGDIVTVRSRIVSVLQQLGYDILDDDELMVRGRRAATGWAVAFSSADVLEYARTLVIKLKASGDHATRVTFDYVIKHPSLSKGEKAILTREAEAISSLATARRMEKICPACGTESTDDSRFCRRCGTPMTVESRELELLSMAAEIRAGYTSIVTSEIVMFSSTLILAVCLVAMFVNGGVLGKGLWTWLLISGGLSVLNMIFIAFGWNRMSRSLEQKRKGKNVVSPASVLEFHAGSATYLSNPTPPPSIIEGTTSLLAIDSNPTKPIDPLELPQKRITLSNLDQRDLD